MVVETQYFASQMHVRDVMTRELSLGLEKLPNAEGEGDGDWPRLVSVKRTTGTERPGASLFERKARVCDANSGVQGASSEADEALIFWFFCIKAKERSFWVGNFYYFCSINKV